MFGGLTKTSSRIAIAAALGLTFGGYALSHSPANAADFGGDCCADLEERVAELEATTVRKGNKKVSVTLSGWVIKAMNYWDDGQQGSFFVADKSYDLGTRFAITGSATIAPGWSGGYNITVNAFGTGYGVAGTQIPSNQFDESGVSGLAPMIQTLYSYGYVKSDKYGTLNWGHLSPASDNPAVLADISGTVIESNAVFFEGASFAIRPSGPVTGTFAGPTWGHFLQCTGLAAAGAGIGADCWGAAQPAVRYDTPTWGGFRFETSYGTNTLTGPAFGIPSPSSNFWDIAAFYNGDWGNFKVSGAYAFTWIETAVATGNDANLHQVGATVMHSPSGLGIYGLYQNEESTGAPTTDVWYLKPFIQGNWTPLGKTVLYGEWGQYNDQFASLAGANLCAPAVPAADTASLVTGVVTPAGTPGLFAAGGTPVCGVAAGGLFVTDSEVERWGLGVVQEIDAAAMHLFARWQHMDLDVNLVDGTGTRRNQGFRDFNVIQFGGIWFF